MKHPCKPCVGRHGDGDEPRRWMAGGENLAWVSQLVYLLPDCRDETSLDFFSLPLDPDRSKLNPTFSFKYCCQSYLQNK
jgi:hypothetical protein